MQTSTTYLGMRLAHPFMAGASPFGYSLDAVKRLEDAGSAAIVLHSLFEEQISYEQEGRVAGVSVFDPGFEEVFAAFPAPDDYRFGPDEYCEHIRRVKRSVEVPVIASLNGRTKEAWLKCAGNIEEAGADALELNIYQVVTDLAVPAIHVESQLVGIVRELKAMLRIPVAVKLSPFFTALGDVARRLDEAGADGLILFNRFYQPDIDLRTLTAVPTATLSTSAELLLRLRWIAILHGRLRPSLAVTGGVGTPQDAIKALLAGADAVQVVSALLRHGASYLATLRRGLEEWLARHQFEALDDIKGAASLQSRGNPSAFERAHYIRALQTWGAEGRRTQF